MLGWGLEKDSKFFPLLPWFSKSVPVGLSSTQQDFLCSPNQDRGWAKGGAGAFSETREIILYDLYECQIYIVLQ